MKLFPSAVVLLLVVIAVAVCFAAVSLAKLQSPKPIAPEIAAAGGHVPLVLEDEPDHSAAYATLVEICFGLNTGFAFLTAFRSRFSEMLKERLLVCVAKAQAREGERTNHIDQIQTGLRAYVNQHTRWQEVLGYLAIAAFLISGLACLYILVTDKLAVCGHRLICLLLPIFLYIILGGLNYAVFYGRSAFKLGRFFWFKREFEPADDFFAKLDSEGDAEFPSK